MVSFSSRQTVILLVVAAVAAVAGARAATEENARQDALDYAFRFATAIESDPKDQGRAQQWVVTDKAAVGDFDAAKRQAEQIEGWRQGVAFADIAAELAKAGNTKEARAYIEKAEARRRTADGWHMHRIAAHLAHALALAGDTERSTAMAADLASRDPRQYEGRAAAVNAAALAKAGKFDEAIAQLEKLDIGKDADLSWWRTSGYLTVAQEASLADEQIDKALAKARESAGQVPDWRKIQALEAVSEEYRKAGNHAAAVEAVQAAETELSAFSSERPAKAPLLATLALHWARLDETERVTRALAEAERIAPNNISIERPYVYAQIGAAYSVAGRTEDADRLFDTALREAESLVNSRPRALAVVAICRSMGREDIALTGERRGRLDALYASLGDPW